MGQQKKQRDCRYDGEVADIAVGDTRVVPVLGGEHRYLLYSGETCLEELESIERSENFAAEKPRRMKSCPDSEPHRCTMDWMCCLTKR